MDMRRLRSPGDYALRVSALMPMTSAGPCGWIPKSRRHPHSPQRRQRAAGRSHWASSLSNRTEPAIGLEPSPVGLGPTRSSTVPGTDHRQPLGRALPPAVGPRPKPQYGCCCCAASAQWPGLPLTLLPMPPVHPPVQPAVCRGCHCRITLRPLGPETRSIPRWGLRFTSPRWRRFSFHSHEYHPFWVHRFLCQGISCQTSASSPVPV